MAQSDRIREPKLMEFYTGPSGLHVVGAVRVPICQEVGLLAPFHTWLGEMERQLVRQCGARPLPPWAHTWPWETRSSRTVGAKARRHHGGVTSPPLLAQRPARFLAFYGLERFAVGHKDGLALSGLLEYIGLTRRQREAFEMRYGLAIVETEIGAALGITQPAVNQRLATARARIARWLLPLPAVQPKPYRSAISVERTHDCVEMGHAREGCNSLARACRVRCQLLQNYQEVAE